MLLHDDTEKKANGTLGLPVVPPRDSDVQSQKMKNKRNANLENRVRSSENVFFLFCFVFCFLFAFSRAAPVAYGGSQARGAILSLIHI